VLGGQNELRLLLFINRFCRECGTFRPAAADFDKDKRVSIARYCIHLAIAAAVVGLEYLIAAAPKLRHRELLRALS
jgi:hypothetical protein